MRTGLSLQQANAAPWTQAYGYDEYGRLLSSVSPAGSFDYTYNRFNQIGSITMLGGYAIDYRLYDDLNRLTQTDLQHYSGGWASLDQHGYTYNAGSQRTRQTFRDGNYVDYTYDKIGQLKTARGVDHAYDGQIGQYVDSPRLHEQFGYEYDAAWNLNRRTNNALAQTFAVNNRNELSSASRSGTLTVAGATGQRRGSDYGGYHGATNVTVSGTGLASGRAELYLDGSWARAGAAPANGANTYSAVASDFLGRTAQDTVTVNLPSTVSYTYDGNGNLTSDGSRTFEYGFENQLTNMYVSGQWRSEFAYDAMMRRRVRREYTWSGGAWVKTNEVRYVYDGRLVIQERDANNLSLVTYTRGKDLSGGFEGAGGIGGLLARTDNRLTGVDAHAYYHFDGNGNVVSMINTNGTVVARYSYDPFGNILAKSGSLADVNLYRFSSKEYHPNSDLVYYLYRYYEPSLQRWVNRDPIGESGGVNVFVAFGNSPILNIDTFGLNTIRVRPNCAGVDLSSIVYLAEAEPPTEEDVRRGRTDGRKRCRSMPGPGQEVEADAIYEPGRALKIGLAGQVTIDCSDGSPRLLGNFTGIKGDGVQWDFGEPERPHNGGGIFTRFDWPTGDNSFPPYADSPPAAWDCQPALNPKETPPVPPINPHPF